MTRGISPRRSRLLSENDFEANLQLSHAYVGVEAGHRAEAAAARNGHAAGIQMVGRQRIARTAKVGMVEEIEGIKPQLNVESFGESEILIEGGIDAEQVRADDRVPSQVSEGELRLQSKRLHIKPLLFIGIAERR